MRLPAIRESVAGVAFSGSMEGAFACRDMEEILERMISADTELYERILDTSGFAKAFNDLCLLAGMGKELLEACEETLPRFLELKRYREQREGKNFTTDFDAVEIMLRRVISQYRGKS